MACREERVRRASTGTSVRALSSSHRWRREDRPSKQSRGTLEMWFASNRLGKKDDSKYEHCIKWLTFFIRAYMVPCHGLAFNLAHNM